MLIERRTAWALSAGSTLLPNRCTCSMNISCGMAPRFMFTSTVAAPAWSAAAVIRSITSSRVPQGMCSASRSTSAMVMSR